MADDEWKEMKRVTNAQHGDLVGQIEDRVLNADRVRFGTVAMKALTDAEIAYLSGQRLGRLATVGPNGQHVFPVGFRDKPEQDTIDSGGHRFARVNKFRDVPANPRGERFGRGYEPLIFRVRPRRLVGWGIEPTCRAMTVPR